MPVRSVSLPAQPAGGQHRTDGGSEWRLQADDVALQAAGAALLAALGPLVGHAHLPATPFRFLGGLLAGTAHGFLYPALTALVVDVTPPDRRGRMVGVFRAFMLAGQAGGAAGFGYLAHAARYGHMFAVLSVVLAGACARAFRLER